MADLASIEDLATVLGLTEAQAELREELLTLLLDGAEALFEAQTGRTEVPFVEAATGRVEILDARLGRRLWLDYPIEAVTAIALGVNLGDPAVTLDPDDASQVIWHPGTRQLLRTDGGGWSSKRRPFEECPSFVQVTYDTQDDLPEDAKQAVLRLAATMYGELTTRKTGIASETLDNYSVTFVNQSTFGDAALKDPAWSVAVDNHRRFAPA